MNRIWYHAIFKKKIHKRQKEKEFKVTENNTIMLLVFNDKTDAFHKVVLIQE